MSRSPKPYHKNAPGPFHVKADIKANCGYCGHPSLEAPDLIRMEEGGPCYFARQPETPEEVKQACSVVGLSCFQQHFYSGDDPNVLSHLKDEASSWEGGPAHHDERTRRWIETAEGIGLVVLSDMRVVKTAYSERHRRYHTLEHLDDCLEQLERFKHLAEEPHTVAMALWFHDLVMDYRSKTNEQESAAWARDRLVGVSEGIVRKVEAHILATAHAGEAHTGDTALVVDIDLSILGRDVGPYDHYAALVREEYEQVYSREKYNWGRKRFLKSLLKRERIFTHEEIAEAYEAQARINLTRELATL